MTLLWLLTGSVLANIAIWSGQKMAPSIGMSLVTLGLALGWFHTPYRDYVAHPRNGFVHAETCLSVRGASDLLHYESLEEALHAGLTPHHCVRRSESAMYTVMIPKTHPAANDKK